MVLWRFSTLINILNFQAWHSQLLSSITSLSSCWTFFLLWRLLFLLFFLLGFPLLWATRWLFIHHNQPHFFLPHHLRLLVENPRKSCHLQIQLIHLILSLTVPFLLIFSEITLCLQPMFPHADFTGMPLVLTSSLKALVKYMFVLS